MSEFRITRGKGFQVTFDNGITLSTQFGAGNYCENHSYDPQELKRPAKDITCSNAEIAIWQDFDKTWLTRQAYKDLFNEDIEDDVKGWIDTSEWAKLIQWCENYGK